MNPEKRREESVSCMYGKGKKKMFKRKEKVLWESKRDRKLAEASLK